MQERKPTLREKGRKARSAPLPTTRRQRLHFELKKMIAAGVDYCINYFDTIQLSEELRFRNLRGIQERQGFIADNIEKISGGRIRKESVARLAVVKKAVARGIVGAAKAKLNGIADEIAQSPEKFALELEARKICNIVGLYDRKKRTLLVKMLRQRGIKI